MMSLYGSENAEGVLTEIIDSGNIPTQEKPIEKKK